MDIQHSDHPLLQSFIRIHQLSHYLGAHLGAPTEPMWLTPAELLAPDSPHLSELIRTLQKRLHTEAANTIGSSLLQEYQWPLIAVAVACFLVDRRVPALHPESVRLRVSVEEHEDESVAPEPRIAFTSGRFVALPHDPAATHPDAIIVADEEALRAHLRTELETHFAWVIERLSAAVDCNRRGLWLYVTDRIASTLAWLMQEQDQQSCLTCVNRAADPLIRVAGSPLFNKKVGFFELTYKERTHVYLDRTTCCFWYKTDGGDYCSTCPHRTKEERNERLLKYMAENYEKAA